LPNLALPNNRGKPLPLPVQGWGLLESVYLAFLHTLHSVRIKIGTTMWDATADRMENSDDS